jgi:hypothetical protein
VLGQGKGHSRDSVAKDGVRRGGCRGKGRSAAWRGKERDRLDAGGTIGMGIESQMVGCGHWHGIGRGRPDAISWCGI